MIITESMFDNLFVYASILNTGQSYSGLLFASDKETGEMVCLDGSSILSITKVK